MNPFKRLLNPESEKLVDVELARNCFISGTHHQAGEIIRVTERVAQELTVAENAIRRDQDEAQRTEQDRLARLIPGPVLPQPMPEDWKSLPPFFAEMHAMDSAVAALMERRDLIWVALLAKMNRFVPLAGPGMGNFAATYDRAHYGDQQRLGKMVGDLGVSVSVPELHLAEIRTLKNAHHAAEVAIRDWSEMNRDKWNRARFHASQHVLQKHGEVCRSIRELHTLGREIFALRISALGLGESKVSELFQCSADAVQYCGIEQPSLSDIKLAYADDAGPVHYLEKSPTAMVNLLRIWEQTAVSSSKLTTQARKELAAAKKVQAAA